jgi:hypothetical protein
MKWTYVDESRISDHICYYSDLRKMKNHYPQWGTSRASCHRFFRKSHPVGPTGSRTGLRHRTRHLERGHEKEVRKPSIPCSRA